MSTTYTDDEINRLLREAYADTEPLAEQSGPSWEAPLKVRRLRVSPLVLAGAAATVGVAGIALTRADPSAPVTSLPASRTLPDPATADVTLTPEPGGSASAPTITASAEVELTRARRMADVAARFEKAAGDDAGFSAVVGDNHSSRTGEISVYRVGGATDAARARYGNLDRDHLALYFHDAVAARRSGRRSCGPSSTARRSCAPRASG